MRHVTSSQSIIHELKGLDPRVDQIPTTSKTVLWRDLSDLEDVSQMYGYSSMRLL